METLEMSVKAGKLAKLMASRNFHHNQQQQYQYERRHNQEDRRVLTAVIKSTQHPHSSYYLIFTQSCSD